MKDGVATAFRVVGFGVGLRNVWRTGEITRIQHRTMYLFDCNASRTSFAASLAAFLSALSLSVDLAMMLIKVRNKRVSDEQIYIPRDSFHSWFHSSRQYVGPEGPRMRESME